MRPLRRLPNRLAFALPLLRRLPAIGALALLAASLRLCAPAPAPADQDGVAAMLGEAVDGAVARDGFVWERSRGWLVDALLGRRALFLAAVGEGPRDLFRAEVRVSREGRPIGVAGVAALTETPLGDETSLVARGDYAAFATRWDEAVQGVTVLELGGRGQASWTRWWSSAASDLGRIELAFRRPPTTVRMQLLDDELRMAVGENDKAATLALDSLSLEHDTGVSGEAWRQSREGSRLDLFDDVQRWWRRLWGADETVTVEPEAALPAAGDGGWPPALAGASWSPRDVGVVGDPPLLTASLSIDGDAVTLVAIDTRHLDLGYRAGRRHPRAETGPHGSGTVPETLAPRVVGVFNGGEAGGAVDGGRVLVPPQASRATVAVDRHGRARLGPLSSRSTKTGDLVGLRQGDTLIAGDARPATTGGRVPRSALGRTADGFLVYGFSAAASGHSLALALRQAGCVYAVTLRGHDEPQGFLSWPAASWRQAARPTPR